MRTTSPRHHLAGLAGLLCLGWLLGVVMSVACGETPAEGDRISRHIAYSFLLRNTTNRVVDQVEFWTYAPVARTATQQCTELSSSQPFEIVTDAIGNQILHFTLSKLPPYGVKRITIEADLLLTDPSSGGQRGLHEAMPTVPDRARYLQPEPYCESDDPEIRRLAGQFRRADVMSTVEQIFQWVTTHVRSTGYLKQPRGARYALMHKQGDCTEFMYVFIALCRAAGIPARGVGGYLVTRNTILDPAAYHNWAEFYHQGGWHLADPQQQVLREHQSHYLVMRRINHDAVNNDAVNDAPVYPLPQFRRFCISTDSIDVTME